MRITIATSPAEIDALRPLWERAYLPEQQTVFQEFELNRLSAAHFADRELPYVVVAQSDSSLAIIPSAARRHDGAITMLGETLFDYRDVLHAGSNEALIAAWDEIAKLHRPLSFFALRPESQKRWATIPTTSFTNAPCIRHNELDCDEFRAAHNRLGMYSRRLIKRGVHLHFRSGKDARLVRAIYDAKASQFHDTSSNVFLDPLRREFMALACERMGDRCEIFTLESSTALVAALVTFRDAQARRFYTIYFDPEWSKFSPGIVLIYEVTARTLGEGLDCDYMTGEYGYKNRLATSMVPLLRVEATSEQLAAARKKAA